MPERSILMGVIGRPHGVRGHVRVVSYTSDPESLAEYCPLSDGNGRLFTLKWVGQGIAQLSDVIGAARIPIADRAAAERLTNTKLFVDRRSLPPTDDDEFYLADLIGLAAKSPEGATLGEVCAVHDYGAGASLEIAREGGPPLIVPFNRACVPAVGIVSGDLTVILPDETIVAAPDAAGEEAA